MAKQILIFLILIIFSFAEIVPAQGKDSEVAIIYNKKSPYGYKIAKHYADVYKIPDKFLIGINCVTNEAVIMDYYIKHIRNPVRNAIKKRNLDVKYLVTTKGIPLKIYVKSNYCYGLQIGGGSVESWLCLLDSDNLTNCRKGAYIRNGYAKSNKPFEKNAFKFYANCPNKTEGYLSYLVSRLDAYSYKDVIAMIDRGANAYKKGDAYYILDRSPGHSDMMIQANSSLKKLNCKVMLENTRKNLTSLKDKSGKRDLPVIAYCGHGAWAEGNPFMGWKPDRGYLGGSHFKWMNGAAFYTHESFNAYSFNYKNNGCKYTRFLMGQLLGHANNQNLLADFIKDGGTVAIGRVYHPSGSVSRDRADESVFFSKYAEGYKFIEAAYMSIARLGFSEVVVGDPLCRIKSNPGNTTGNKKLR